MRNRVLMALNVLAIVAGAFFLFGSGQDSLVDVTLKELRIDVPVKRDISQVPSATRIASDYGRIPLLFIPNRGQFDRRVSFAIRGSDMSVYFSPEGLTYQLFEREKTGDKKERRTLRGIGEKSDSATGSRRSWALKLDFVDCRPDVKPESLEESPTLISYFRGKKSEWKTGIRASNKIVYRELWPGIDLVYSGTVNKMKYEFLVKPGADPSKIRLAYRGADNVDLNGEGQLEFATPLGGFSDDAPVAWQGDGKERKDVAVSYKLGKKTGNGSREYGFTIGEYDRSQTLVLDPAVLVYCGYIGGSVDDIASGVAVDRFGCTYLAGDTGSTETSFPAEAGPGLVYQGERDVFVAKLTASGSDLAYCGYIGGSGQDSAKSVAIDAFGCAYVAGYTFSTEATFPVVTGPGLIYKGSRDVFVAKVSADGTGLVYCGYIGGSAAETANGIAVDGSGCAYVTGYTRSTAATFPVATGPDLNYNGGDDGFVAKVSAEGTGLVYCGYIGGSGDEFANGIAVDGSGCAYVAGYTWSTQGTFPVATGPDLTQNGIYDGFVAKISASGASLVYCGYIGGSNVENVNGIAVDRLGCAYVTGYTTSTEATFPVASGPDLTFNGDVDAFIAKVSAAGTDLVYCGYIGGSSDEYGYGVAVDGSGCACVSGFTFSTETTFPVTAGPDLTHNGNIDAFVAKLGASGASLVYCGYIGGAGEDQSLCVAVEASGCAYVAGYTMSTEATFPVATGPDLTCNGSADAFVAKVGILSDISYDGNGNTGGTAPIDGDSPYLTGSTVIVMGPETLVCDEHSFAGWNTAADGSGDSYSEGNSFTMPEHDVTLYAQWIVAQYVITATAGSGGTIAPSGVVGVTHGSDQAFNITPDSGYRVLDVLVDEVSQGAVKSYTFNNVTAGHTIEARFANSAPLVMITQPSRGAMVSGVVEVRAMADDDSGIAGVELYVDGTLRSSQTLKQGSLPGAVSKTGAAREYLFNWDTAAYAAGQHTLRVVARDASGASGSDEVTVNLVRISLSLSATRETTRAWSFERQYGLIQLAINCQGSPIGSGKLLRKSGSGSWQAINEITAAELQSGSWSYQDKYLDKNTAYSYVIEINDATGNLLARSIEAGI